VQGVIEFWRAVEMFSPPAVPKVDSDLVNAATVGRPLPWSADHPLRREKLTKHQTWRHYVYVGTYDRGAVFDALEPLLDPDPTHDNSEDYDQRPSGQSALLGFVVSEDGTLARGSAVLSVCAWATGRAFKPGLKTPHWLDGFDGLEEDFSLDLEDRYLGPEDEQRPPVVIDLTDLAACRDSAIAALGIGEHLKIGGIRVSSQIVSRRAPGPVDRDFLNSFIATDLARVARATGRGEVGGALREYLRPDAELEPDRRVDVRTELDEVRRATGPGRIPLGRWPAAADRPLALGQQLAVDEAIALPLAGEYIFAVNGPPGTGKTTMLRDLIAGIVTERAERMAELSDPDDAFVGDPDRWQAGDLRRVVHRLRPELTGFEMVVASSNNAAVENITMEIPSAGAIDAPWRERAGEIDYFTALAERAVRAALSDQGKHPPKEEATAWGLVAARLGKAANRREFAQAVWWTEEWDEESKTPKPPPGLRELLARWEEQPEGPSWAQAVAAFRQAREQAVAIRDERLRTAAELDRLPGLEERAEAAGEAKRAAHDKVVDARPRRVELAEEARQGEGELRRLLEAREEELARRPFVLRFLARAAWRERERRRTAEIAAAESRLREVEHELDGLKVLSDADAEATDALIAAEAALEECRQVIAGYEEQPGSKLPDALWCEDRRERELRAPWSDEQWNRARTELFLALALHKAFLVHAAKPMRQALDGAMDVLTGRAPRDLSRDATLAAWQALFIVVPVVSTTFASVGRLFGGLGPESLGWLLVDEAGQATPQSAVGALWRCRRAVVVGDPRQLEPISSIPFPLEQALRGHFHVEERWLTSRGSVQGLADRLARLGTTLPGPDRGKVWVGAPLTVHRRCDQPMFDLSNRISYDETMIEATDPTLGPAFRDAHPGLPESKWIDVPPGSSEGHWRPAEGAAVVRILDYLKGSGFDFEEVFAISPFRDVARHLVELGFRYRGLRAGTIHTAQGKEADIVILVLGSDPRRPGARDWSAGKPNLLNVAVSRARRRLYVIGDYDAWKSLPNFKLLARRLPHERPPA
jgi:AAA domain